MRIHFNENEKENLFALPFEFEHATRLKNEVDIILSDFELTLLNQVGLNYDIIQNDMSTFYANRKDVLSLNSNFLFCNQSFNDTVSIPEQFNLGLMGGFLTYAEMLLELDSMVMNYPDLITVKQAIDTFETHEGRPIYFVKISDNANTNESSTEDKVLYTALHHAREPQSMMQLIFYMQYLLENYGSNKKIDYIVDNLELYFVPCINPDGYIYNETTNPTGGGLWRKNRRDNEDGSFGVDLNRNYGESWGSDDIGSSPNPFSDTYRGNSPFSEPETQAIKYLCENNDFLTTLNYHSYSNVLIFPEGYENDSLRYVRMSQKFTENNFYTYGTGSQTLGYAVNGDSDAWMYHDISNKIKQYAFTPEVGNSDDGFWPIQSRILPLCKENLLANINVALVTGDYVSIENSSTYQTEKQDQIKLAIQSFGLDNIGSAEIEIANSLYFENIDAAQTVNLSGDMTIDSVTINYNLNQTAYESMLIPFELKLTLDDIEQTETLHRIYSTQQPIYADRFDVSNTDWDVDFWGRTDEEFVSFDLSMTDSPHENYMPNLENKLVLNKQIDLTDPVYTAAYLRFNAKWETENGYDYVQLFVDNGFEKKAMCGNYTSNGVGFTGQPDGEPLYDGVMNNWVTEHIDLNEFLGQAIEISFVMKSDGAIEMDGFYFDNFKIYALREKGKGLSNKNIITPELKILPNPVKTSIFIELNTNINTISVYNSVGVKVYEQSNINRMTYRFNTSNLSDGLYHVMIKSGKSIYSKHFIKE